MFGLVRVPRDKASESYGLFRQHSCGMCKAIGKLYGNLPRVFLNNDITLMSAVVSAMSESNPQSSCKSCSGKCFSHNTASSMLSEYFATINLLLARLKVRDNIQDGEHKVLWKVFEGLMQKRYRSLPDNCSRLGINLEEIEQLFETNATRESEPFQEASGAEYYAHPTARITALTASGAAQCLSFTTEKRDMLHHFGYLFGQNAYLIDALIDYDKDQKHGDFNYFVNSEMIVTDCLMETRRIIRRNFHQIDELFQDQDNVQELIGHYTECVGEIVDKMTEKFWKRKRAGTAINKVRSIDDYLASVEADAATACAGAANAKSHNSAPEDLLAPFLLSSSDEHYRKAARKKRRSERMDSDNRLCCTCCCLEELCYHGVCFLPCFLDD